MADDLTVAERAPAVTAGTDAPLDEVAMNDLKNSDIINKYRTAAEIANGAGPAALITWRPLEMLLTHSIRRAFHSAPLASRDAQAGHN